MIDFVGSREVAQKQAEQYVSLTKERVLHQLFAVHALLCMVMKSAPPGTKAIVRVGGDGFY